MSPTFQALSIRNFRVYSGGSLISNTGTWMQRVAQDWLVLQLTASGAALGVTTGLQFLPFLLVTPFAGLLADRYSKRRLMLLTQGSLLVTSAVLGLLAVTGSAQVWHVWVLAFLFGCGTATDTPARQSFVIEMVGRDNLPNAVGLNSASFNMGRIAGPAAAGFLIALLGGGVRATGAVILVNALSYLAVIWSLRIMRTADLHTSIPLPRAKGALRDGVRYIRESPLLVFVFVVAFFAGTFGLNFQMTSALMATSVFDKGAAQYGLLGTIMAIGALGGSLLGPTRLPAAAFARPGAYVVRGGGDRGGAHADLLDFCGHPAAARHHIPDDDELPANGGSDVCRRRHTRTGHGAVHDGTDGRHAGRGAGGRLGRRDLRGAVDVDRRRRSHAAGDPVCHRLADEGRGRACPRRPPARGAGGGLTDRPDGSLEGVHPRYRRLIIPGALVLLLLIVIVAAVA